MNINLTLIGQSIAFVIFVWFCMKFVWPPIISALNERKTKIADGLEIIRRAERREVEMIEEAKGNARTEGERILVAARSEIEKEANLARESLRGQLATLAVAGASRILAREGDPSAHAQMLDDLTAEL